jgi:cysteine desulfurase
MQVRFLPRAHTKKSGTFRGRFLPRALSPLLIRIGLLVPNTLMIFSKKIYLDYAATTPIGPVVLRAMQPYFSEKFGNAGSLHSFGQEAITALDAARETLAASVNADFREIIFTGSATEANNLALRGALNKWRIINGKSPNPRIIVSVVEHESILETTRGLENDGVDVIYLPVNRIGTVDIKKLEASLNKHTVLVSIMYANNEIGTIQPITEITKIIGEFKESRITNDGLGNKSVIRNPQLNNYPFFHTDASQAFQFLDCNTDTLNIDLMTLSSHKIYGPKGAGALYIKKRTSISPVLTGGGQEFGIRAGTENIPATIGFSKATELLADSRRSANKKIAELRGELWRGIKKICPKAEINNAPSAQSLITDHLLYLPNILNVYFPKYDAQDLLTRFDLLGLAASSGSACRARTSLSSYVIEALGYSKERARSSIRFSFGRPTTKMEVSRALKIIKKTIKS